MAPLTPAPTIRTLVGALVGLSIRHPCTASDSIDGADIATRFGAKVCRLLQILNLRDMGGLGSGTTWSAEAIAMPLHSHSTDEQFNAVPARPGGCLWVTRLSRAGIPLPL